MKLDTKTALVKSYIRIVDFFPQPLYNSLGETVQRVETLQSLHAQVFPEEKFLMELICKVESECVNPIFLSGGRI